MEKRMVFGTMWLFLSLMAGCASADTEEVADKAPLRIPVVATARSGGSSVANTTIEVDGSQLGFFVEAEDYYSTVSNKPYVYRSGIGWAPVDGEPIWLSTLRAAMTAYYPWSSAITEHKVKLTAGERNPDAPQDLWYKAFYVDSHTPDVSLTLLQAYSRLKVTFVTHNNYPVDAYLYALHIKDDGQGDAYTGIFENASLYMDVEDCRDRSMQAGSDRLRIFNTENIVDAKVVKKSATETSAKFDIMMIPALLKGNIQIIIRVGGEKYAVNTKEMEVLVPASAFEGQLEAGKVYNLTITVSSRGLSFYRIDAQPWTNSKVSGDYGMS